MIKLYGHIYKFEQLLDGVWRVVYVGQSVQEANVRELSHQNGDQFLDHAIRLYGWNNFRYSTITWAADAQELNEKENQLIEEYGVRKHGYNRKGGQGISKIKNAVDRVKKYWSSGHRNMDVENSPIYTQYRRLTGNMTKLRKYSSIPEHRLNILEVLTEKFGNMASVKMHPRELRLVDGLAREEYKRFRI
jgi:hypothetical protein